MSEGIAFDKNWVACDNTVTSTYYGRCYLVYTHASDRDMLAVTWSDDGGLTWSLPGRHRRERRRSASFRRSGRPASSSSCTCRRPVSSESPRPARRTAVGPGALLSGSPTSTQSCAIRGFRAFPLPSAEADASGRVWAAWHSCEPGASGNAVFVATSPDGAVWSAPRVVTRGRNALLPAIGIDAATGRVAIAYMRSTASSADRRRARRVATGGSRWSAARRLSAQSMPLVWMPRTTSGRMLGDYISVHYASGRPLVVWVLASRAGRRELPAGGLRDARLTPAPTARMADGCQTVLSSRKASISHGL